MELSQQQIERYQQAYQVNYGILLPPEVARRQAEQLIMLIKLLTNRKDTRHG